MSDRIRIACPSCRRELKVRTEYLGLQVLCKHCGEGFEARAEPISAAPEEGPPGRGVADLAVENQALRARLGELTEESRGSMRKLAEAEAQFGHLQEQMTTLQGHHQLVRDELRHFQDLLQERDDAIAERDQMRTELARLRRQVRDADWIDEHLGGERALRELDRGERSQGDGAVAGVHAVPNAEVDRLSEELRSLRDSSERQAAEAGAALDRLLEELNAARAARDWLREEAHGLRQELQARSADAEQVRRLSDDLDTLHVETIRLRDERRKTLAALEARGREIERLAAGLAQATATAGAVVEPPDALPAGSLPLGSRPEIDPAGDLDAAREALESWLRAAGEARDRLALEIEAARASLAALHRDLILDDWGSDPADELAAD